MTEKSRSKFEVRAYEIWEREGRPHGKALEHWFQAISEINREEAEAEAAKVKKAASRKTAATKKRAARPKKSTTETASKKNAEGRGKKSPSPKKSEGGKQPKKTAK